MNPAPKWPPESQNPATKGPQETAIRAVLKLKDRVGRPSPYGVQWRSTAGRKREFFKTEASRDLRFASLSKTARNGGLGAELTRDEKQAWSAFLVATKGTPWQDVVAGWRRDLATSGLAPCERTVTSAAEEYLKHAAGRLEGAEISRGYHTHLRQKVGLFTQAFGASRLDSLTGEAIEQWIDDLGYPANGTFNMYRKIIAGFFQHFRKEVKNPCDEIKTRSEAVANVGILTVAETSQLFAYAQKHHRDALGRLALEAFAGLRFSSAFRLEKSDINFEDRGILLPAQKLKTGIRTGRRHYIDGLPDNLWLWLKATNAACWAMESSDWMHLKSRVFTDSKVPHPPNCLRHSFCTYHVAAHKDPGLTSTILCHRNQQKLWAAYNGNARQADGRAYFEIKPAA